MGKNCGFLYKSIFLLESTLTLLIMYVMTKDFCLCNVLYLAFLENFLAHQLLIEVSFYQRSAYYLTPIFLPRFTNHTILDMFDEQLKSRLLKQKKIEAWSKKVIKFWYNSKKEHAMYIKTTCQTPLIFFCTDLTFMAFWPLNSNFN